MELRRRTRGELLAFLGVSALLVAVDAIEPFEAERPYSHEAADRVARDHVSPRQRFGFAVLQRAGYGRAERVEVEEGLAEVLGAPPVLVHRSHSHLACLPHEVVDVDGAAPVHVHHLATAIIAAERYNRSPFERRMEFAAARAALRLGRPLPEYSLGIAQLRPAVAREVVRAELAGFEIADPELLELLAEPCQNVRIAAKHVRDLVLAVGPAANALDVVTRVARVYGGVATPSVSGIRYVDAVAGAYELLTAHEGYLSFSRGESPEAGPLRVCMAFSAGSPDAIGDPLRSAVEGGDEGVVLSTDATVRVKLVENEPGPAAYRERLRALRRASIGRTLVALGFSIDRVHFDADSGVSGAAGPCAEMSTQASFAVVELPRDRTAAEAVSGATAARRGGAERR